MSLRLQWGLKIDKFENIYQSSAFNAFDLKGNVVCKLDSNFDTPTWTSDRLH